MADYSPPLGNSIGFNFGTAEYTSPSGNSVGIEFNPPTGVICEPDYIREPSNVLIIDFDSCDRQPDYSDNESNVLEIYFNCCPPPECEPDWINQSGDNFTVVLDPCNGNPTWSEKSGDGVIIEFDCCPKDTSCEPTWVEQNGTNLALDINSCSGNPNRKNQQGVTLAIDFDCCANPEPKLVIATGNVRLGVVLEGEATFTQSYDMYGITKPLTIASEGYAFYDNTATVWGDITLSIASSGSAQRGEYVTGSLSVPVGTMVGDVTHLPEAYKAEGSITISTTLSGVVATFNRVVATGDILLTPKMTGEITIPFIASGFENNLSVISEGVAETTLVTVLASNIIVDAPTARGEAEYNTVPTVFPSQIVVAPTMLAYAAYVELPTIFGDIKVDAVLSQPVRPIEVGNLVYWRDIIISPVMQGEVITPVYATGDMKIDEINCEGNGIVAVAGSVTPMTMLSPIFNRGWVEFGDPEPPQLRQIYESSTIRSSDIKQYPIDAKYPIYIPTTDYNIRNVELRRGTLDYTIEFNFDGLQVEKIVVWIVDENGNSTKDSIAKYIGGSTVPHELKTPFKYLYSLTIPVHCVAEKKYEFYLEIVYESESNGGTTLYERKSFITPFQAHFDNRNPYTNATDKITSIDALFGNTIPTNMIDVSMVEFESTQYVTEDVIHTINISTGTPETNLTYIELSKIDWVDSSQENICAPQAGVLQFTNQYFELDIGQIGG